MLVASRGGFTVRLKRFQARAPRFRGAPKLWKDNFQHFCKQLFVFLFWFNARYFTMPLTKDLFGRMSAKHWSEWRWAFSFYGVENCFLLRIICGTKRLNPFFRLHDASEVLNKYVMGVWSDNFTAVRRPNVSVLLKIVSCKNHVLFWQWWTV